MKKAFFICWFLPYLIPSIYSQQVNCDDYKIVSIFDIPPSPQTPGGNYFLMLLTLDKDNLSNIDIYANLFFVSSKGDTISIPTGPSSTLPRFASDTIPYILKLNSPNNNQDFPIGFDGDLIIRHATELLCQVEFSNISTSNSVNIDSSIPNVFPNPFTDILNVITDRKIERVLIIDSKGCVVDTFRSKGTYYKLNLNKLVPSNYFVLMEFKDGTRKVHNIVKN